ncbi:MAG: hypothetical protein ACRD9W_28260 [Terriglobia bacterium]
MTIDFAALVKETAERMNKVATASYTGVPYSAPNCAPAWRQPCTCPAWSFAHRRAGRCEEIAQAQRRGQDGMPTGEYDPDAWQNDRSVAP